jgi:hypothetical protein
MSSSYQAATIFNMPLNSASASISNSTPASTPDQMSLHETVSRPYQNRILAIELGVLSPVWIELLSDVLLQFSPRLTHRQTRLSTWFFLDLGTNHSWVLKRFSSEAKLLEIVLEKINSLDLNQYDPTRPLAEPSLTEPCGIFHNRPIKAGIADTAPAAQTLASMYTLWISQPGRSHEDLEQLPLRAISQLEGLTAWEHPARVEHIVNFFSLLGFQNLGDLRAFTPAALHERWGLMGDLLYRRLQGKADLDPQPIEPFVPTESLRSFIHLDFPVSIMSLLLHEVESALKRLLARLEGRRLLARRIRLKMRCEWRGSHSSSQQPQQQSHLESQRNFGHEHVFAIEPSKATRDLRFFRVLLENRLEKIELLNPIQDLEIEIDPIPETEAQENFFDHTSADQNKLAVLISLLGQEGARAGFAELREEVWPEHTWSINPNIFHRPNQPPAAEGILDEHGFAPRFSYGRELPHAPRPTLLLRQPRLLSNEEVGNLHFYSRHPVERLEHGWWIENRAGPTPDNLSRGITVPQRDYYVARDRLGRNLWLFQDHPSGQFYLHGAFD